MPARPTQSAPARRGFTFIEVMFAVLVLGVGVVMVATMLPVAIKQVQDTREGVAATATIEAGFHQIELAHAEGAAMPITQAAGDPQRPWTYPSLDNPPAIAPATPFVNVEPFVRTFGNRVNTADPTMMWVPFYTRQSTAEPAQVAMVAVRARNIEAFPTADNLNLPGGAAFDGMFDANASIGSNGGVKLSNYPLPVLVSTLGGTTFEAGGGPLDLQQPDLIRIGAIDGGPSNQQIREAAVEGAAVVVVDNLGRLRVYRLAAPYDEEADGNPAGTAATTWQLQLDGGLSPDYVVNGSDDTNDQNDFNADALNGGASFSDYADFADGSLSESTPVAAAYLVGRMLADPSVGPANDGWNADNRHVGPSPVAGVLQGTKLR